MTTFFTGIIPATVVIFKGDHGISLGFSYYRIGDIIGYIYVMGIRMILFIIMG